MHARAAANLPATIEAIFVQRGGGSAPEAAYARAVRRRLLAYYQAEYALCDDPVAAQLPLLEYDGAATEAPFTLLLG